MEFVNTLFDCIADGFHDTWPMIPIMFVAYMVIEYFERRPSQSDGLFWNLQKYGPLFGAALGLIPQCGFSILAAMLFCQNSITLGTMCAVFIATSDEAIPVLIAEPGMLFQLGILLVLKFLIAIAVGYFVDLILFPKQSILLFSEMEEDADGEYEDKQEEEFDEGNAGTSCPCCYPQYPIWLSALLRTLKIYIFVFLTTVLLNLIIAWIGPERLSSILLGNSLFQPIIAALFGFIPNCAATVILCQLFAMGQLAFGSLLAGLITNAGMGLLVLFQYGCSKKNIWRTIGILFTTGAVSGVITMLIMKLI